MDRVLFLHSGGGILSRYPNLRSEEPLPVVPYVEQVALPVVSVDSSALYGDHPEDLARLTVSNGAALTFFCDSVAGGGDSSGNGSFDAPWRSLKTASRFLSCHSPLLKKAAPYTQLKIKGTVDYVSDTWSPYGTWGSSLILTGWGEKCDLGTQEFDAGYLFNLRTRGGHSATLGCSGCTLVRTSASKSLAVDCEIESGANISCAYRCRGIATDRRNMFAAVCYGGEYDLILSTYYAYAPVVSVVRSTNHLSCAMTAHAAVSASVTAAVVDSTAVSANAVVGYGGVGDHYFADCFVNVSGAAVTTPGTSESYSVANVCLYKGGSAVISGGSWAATAVASANSTASARAAASAWAAGFEPNVTLHDVPAALVASAGAKLLNTQGECEEQEYEMIYEGGSHSWTSRFRAFSNGVVTSSHTSSGSWNY